MLIGGLQKLTLIDYPGKIACTVFLAGCNFRCPWCYSSELVLPEKIKKQPKVSEEEFFDFLKKRKGLLEAVVICGGEPTINRELPYFCQKIKKNGYFVKIDTNGSEPLVLKNLIEKKLVDYLAMDIKAPIGAKNQKSKAESNGSLTRQEKRIKFSATIKTQSYNKAAGVKVNLEKIRKSVKIIKESGIDYEFRTTVIPGIHSREDIIQIAKDISWAKKFYLQSFRPEKTIDSRFEKLKSYPEQELLKIQKAVSPFFEICQLRH